MNPKFNQYICLIFLASLGCLEATVPSPVWPAPHTLTLKTADPDSFAAYEPFKAEEIKPSFRERAFPLKEAVNLKEVLALVGPLSPAQEAYLEKNRFLVLPKKKMMLFKPHPDGPHDEMLANFDGLGGDLEEALREPWNTRFVGPDVFLHAFYKYYSIRLAALEADRLSVKVRFLLAGLFQNAKTLKAQSGGSAAQSWERLMAQMVVPLVLIDNWPEAKPGGRTGQDSLDGALALFEKYSAFFTPATAKNIRLELRRIYQADSRQNCLLGLVPVDNPQGPLDYSLFQPRGHYIHDIRLRAYYRAMIWLGYLGWSAEAETSLADALNWALAMSYEKAALKPDKKTNLEAAENILETAAEPTLWAVWAEVTTLNAFFLGYHQSPSYMEWLPFLMKEAGVPEFTVDTASEALVLARLKSAGPSLTTHLPYFPALKAPAKSGVISVFPRRFTLPEVIVEELVHQPGLRDDAPRAFSAFWLPVLLGHGYAKEKMPRQLALGYRGRASDAGDDLIRRRLETFQHKIDKLADGLSQAPASDWYSSLSAAWLSLFYTLKGDYGSGYPLYMRSPAFPAKRVQTILGSFAELTHEAVIQGGDEKTAIRVAPVAKVERPANETPPLAKGFIEPNPLFWREMHLLVGHMQAGFAKYDLFPEDLAEFGALWRFSRRLERCAALAEKELRGEELSRDDYEFIRLFSLDWMAAPLGKKGLTTPVEQRRSALASSVQTLLPEHVGGRGAVLYEATGEPNLCLVLVGNEKTPRITIGLTYSHYEFSVPQGILLDDEIWRKAVYGRNPGSSSDDLPPTGFWYEPLKP